MSLTHTYVEKIIATEPRYICLEVSCAQAQGDLCTQCVHKLRNHRHAMVRLDPPHLLPTLERMSKINKPRVAASLVNIDDPDVSFICDLCGVCLAYQTLALCLVGFQVDISGTVHQCLDEGCSDEWYMCQRCVDVGVHQPTHLLLRLTRI
jgi:hypothetical protein